jgi:hypothetical protein
VGDDPQELRREIASIRDDMAETVDELGARLSPRHQASRRVDAARGFLHRVRHAPMTDTTLAYLYAPLLPLTRNIHWGRYRNRRRNPAHVLVPDGYTVEAVATGLNAPVHCCFDDDGFCYVTECGHKIESKPRIVKVDVTTGTSETFFEFPKNRWIQTGAVTGACWHDGQLYVMNTDTLSRITENGELDDVVTDLRGRGDHQANYPVVGPDGKLYFGQGSATNTGVVGADNRAYEWLAVFPDFHDLPGQDVVLAGRNFEYQDVLGSLRNTVRTGAYVPFGTRAGDQGAGQVQRRRAAVQPRRQRPRARRLGAPQPLRHRLPPGRQTLRHRARHR